MDNCPKCGYPIKEGQKYCKKCGTILCTENKLTAKETAKKSVFEDKLKNDPLNVEILHEYSRFLFKNLLFKEAISVLLKILALNEKDGIAKELLFKSYLKLNMLDEAHDAGSQILEEKPDDILIIEELAEISLKQEKYENALKYFNSILNINPKNNAILKKKSEALLQINKLEEAIINLKKIHEIDKSDITANLYVGIDKALNSNFEQALKILLPISSNIENERDKSRSFLYIAYSMSQLNMNIEEIEEWLAKINLPVLEKVNQSLDKDIFVESFLSVVKNKLSNIKPTDNIKFTLNTLLIYYLNPLQEFITEKTKSKIAEVLYAISAKQYKLKLYPDALSSCNQAINYFPSNDMYKEKSAEIKKLVKQIDRKKNIKTIILAASIIFIAVISLLTLTSIKQKKVQDADWLETLQNNTIESYTSYISSYPKGKYIKEAEKNRYGIELMQMSLTSYRNGDYKNAIKYLKEAMDYVHKKDRYLPSLSNLYYEIGEYDSALVVIEPLIEKNPNDHQIIYLKVEYLVKKGDFATALSSLENFILKNTDKNYFLNSYVNLVNNNPEYTDRAINFVDKLIEIYPENIDVQELNNQLQNTGKKN